MGRCIIEGRRGIVKRRAGHACVWPRRTSGTCRIRTGRPVACRPNDAFAARPTALLWLVPALEVRRAWIALGCAIVPHRTATDRAGRHAGCHGPWCCDRSASGGRGHVRQRCSDRFTRGPDDTVALTVLALEIRRLGIALANPVVPHVALTLGARRRCVGIRFGGLLLGHLLRVLVGVFQVSGSCCARLAEIYAGIVRPLHYAATARQLLERELRE